MYTDRELRAGVVALLKEITDKYGHQALPHLYKRLIPKSWSQAQILNCLVEYGLREDRYVIETGPRRGEHVDFFAMYPEDWLKVVSCKQRPRHDLEALDKLGYIRDIDTARLTRGPRKCTTVRINWLAVLIAIRDGKWMLEDYLSWSDPKYVKPVVYIDPCFQFEEAGLAHA